MAKDIVSTWLTNFIETLKGCGKVPVLKKSDIPELTKKIEQINKESTPPITPQKPKRKYVKRKPIILPKNRKLNDRK